MSQLTEKFANHPLHETVQALDSALTEIESSDLSDVSAIERIDRVRQVQRFVIARFGGVDPSLVPQDRLDSINNLFKEQVAQLNAYKTDKNDTRLTNASNTCDQILNQLASIPIATTPAEVEGLREAMISFRRSLGQHARHVETDYDNLNKEFKGISGRFAELTTEITAQKGRLDTAISQFQEQFSEAERIRREEYATESKNTRDELNRILESTKQDVASVTADFRQQFKEAEAERKAQYTTESKTTRDELNRILEAGKLEFSDIAKEHTLTFAKLASDAKESRMAMESEFTKKVDYYLALLDQRKEEAEKLVHVIGNTGMVGGYQQVANQERTSSRYWNAVTGFFILGFIGFAIFAFETIATGDFKLGTFGARAFVAIAFGIGLAWAARQAERHQETERRSRRMELELASISPFLALLPEPTQVEIRKELANRFFGQPEQTQGEKSDKTTGSLLDIVSMAMKAMAELAAKK